MVNRGKSLLCGKPNYPVAPRGINQRLFIAKASTDPELDAAFTLLKREGAGAL